MVEWRDANSDTPCSALDLMIVAKQGKGSEKKKGPQSGIEKEDCGHSPGPAVYGFQLGRRLTR
jgi:hypothetical protein